jgi:hypothetical protein
MLRINYCGKMVFGARMRLSLSSCMNTTSFESREDQERGSGVGGKCVVFGWRMGLEEGVLMVVRSTHHGFGKLRNGSQIHCRLIGLAAAYQRFLPDSPFFQMADYDDFTRQNRPRISLKPPQIPDCRIDNKATTPPTNPPHATQRKEKNVSET